MTCRCEGQKKKERTASFGYYLRGFPVGHVNLRIEERADKNGKKATSRGTKKVGSASRVDPL